MTSEHLTLRQTVTHMVDARVAGLFIVLLLTLVYGIVYRARRRTAPYPPGPPPKPIIGNALDIPFRKSWIKYLELSKTLQSDIIHFSAINYHFVIVHTLEDAEELLERRSTKYSGRPSISIVNLLGMENITAFLPYGKTWRKHRRILDEGLKRDAIPLSYHIQEEKIHLFLERLLEDPVTFEDHCRKLGGSFMLSLVYGYDTIPGKLDNFLESAEFAAKTIAELILPGRTLIGIFGFLRYIPPWVPGATTQRLGNRAKEAAMLYRNGPFLYAKQNIAAATSKDCFLARFLESHSRKGMCHEDEETLKDVMATYYLGGVEALKAAILIFILAMTLHPQQQQRAQKEIDNIVGGDRLPTFRDRASLPYVEALYREVLRWLPVAPLGVPHATDEHDIYKGYHIPKGSFVFPNVWAITRDEERYPEPEAFKPERFFQADGTLNNDSVSYAFGFGRRICPGRYLAESMVWLSIVSMLATFTISKAKDESGNEVDVDPYRDQHG